ncbi:unnamed protein product [Lepeophtheirus salmonis]|uniref:(salmon louse) hypothetical protein n=1 Tax=Lepeophtheirus salmonis TaxID=72036 RepID=A0A7R8H641_LEPSM|nr:unnamed protein product [Lepeophtheirus salmonis]CAF2892588.1 unnamed protein product [Lepeophtheirus salmonis]
MAKARCFIVLSVILYLPCLQCLSTVILPVPNGFDCTCLLVVEDDVSFGFDLLEVIQKTSKRSTDTDEKIMTVAKVCRDKNGRIELSGDKLSSLFISKDLDYHDWKEVFLLLDTCIPKLNKLFYGTKNILYPSLDTDAKWNRMKTIRNSARLASADRYYFLYRMDAIL